MVDEIEIEDVNEFDIRCNVVDIVDECVDCCVGVANSRVVENDVRVDSEVENDDLNVVIAGGNDVIRHLVFSLQLQIEEHLSKQFPSGKVGEYTLL